MWNINKRWPFGVADGNFLRFIAIVLLILAGLLFVDTSIVQGARQLPEWGRAPFYQITRIGDAEWIIVPSLVLAIVAAILAKLNFWSAYNAKFKAVAAMSAFVFVCTTGPGLLANILKRLIGRARPVHLDELGLFHFQPVLNDWTFQSFPSGHTSTMFAFACAITFLFPKMRLWVFMLATLVALSRIIIGMHFPSDIFAGVVTGIFAAYGVRNYWLSRGWIFSTNADGQISPTPRYIAAR
jgi:undecaprenyl-diphosphatase